MESSKTVVSNYLSLVKFSHTIFAMPFALIGFFLGVTTTGASFSARLLILVILCMVFARNAAMAFNRYIDKDFDRSNQRTAVREIPAGIIRPEKALLFVILNCLLFCTATYFINPLCFYLSPVALLVVLGYSYTKRFTALCHLVLGLGLALAPVGAYLAVTGHFSTLPVLYGFAVLTWVSGFDIIYALQDVNFDRLQKLQSIPALFGEKGALHISEFLHLCAAFFVLYAGYFAHFHLWYWIGVSFFILLLIYQHTLVKPHDLSKVNLAFFTTNGIASCVFSVFVLLELFF